jgi:hypothetical protein
VARLGSNIEAQIYRLKYQKRRWLEEEVARLGSNI